MPYELYEQRGREDGHETEDWLEAEAEPAAERHTPLSVAAVKAARKPPVISTGKSKANGLKAEIAGADYYVGRITPRRP